MYSMSYESLFNVMASTNKSIFRSTGFGKILQNFPINNKTTANRFAVALLDIKRYNGQRIRSFKKAILQPNERREF